MVDPVNKQENMYESTEVLINCCRRPCDAVPSESGRFQEVNQNATESKMTMLFTLLSLAVGADDREPERPRSWYSMVSALQRGV